MFPVECVARGYLTGSGLADYRASGEVCGIPLPPGLEDGSRLPEPIFTPATKAAVVSLSMSASVEAPRGVRVHALCPDGVATQMVAEMDPDGTAKATVHSSGRLLEVDEVAREAVALVGSRRVVRTLPSWRGGVWGGGAGTLVLMGRDCQTTPLRRAMTSPRTRMRRAPRSPAQRSTVTVG